MSKQAEKATSIGDLKSQGFVRETVYQDGTDTVELWHHPCFQKDKDNGTCKHEAISGKWIEVRK